MSAVDPVGPAPEALRPSFLWLMFGCVAAPLFWAGQLMLGYAISAFVCYPGVTPRMSGPAFLPMLLMVFDVIALAAALLGGTISIFTWRDAQRQAERGPDKLDISAGRIRLLTLWGMMSSFWFFCAILFNSIASVMAPLCGE